VLETGERAWNFVRTLPEDLYDLSGSRRKLVSSPVYPDIRVITDVKGRLHHPTDFEVQTSHLLREDGGSGSFPAPKSNPILMSVGLARHFVSER
jgi:hypothetical protein